MRTSKRKSPAAKIRIAYVVPLLRGRGGWSAFAAGAIRALAEFVEPVLIVECSDESIAREKFPGLELHTLPTVQAEDWNQTTLSLLRRMAPVLLAAHRLTGLRVRLVHSLEMFPCGWVGDTIARSEGAPHVLTAHGTYAVIWKRWPLLDFFYRLVLQHAAAIHPVSRGTEAKLRELFGASFPRATVHTILDGTDAASKVDRAAALHRAWPAAPLVLSVGEVKPRKGYHVSLRAFALLQRRFPDARYVIVGRDPEGEYRAQLERIIREEGIRNVEFAGAADDARLDSLYREASIFLLLSQEEGFAFEGFGLVYLEAGAYGLPVVGSRSGGIPDAVDDGESGFLVEPGDAEAAAEAMIKMASDRELSAQMGRAGRNRAERLSWERFAAEQWVHYQALLEINEVRE